jgi:hypothetical protein
LQSEASGVAESLSNGERRKMMRVLLLSESDRESVRVETANERRG